MKNKKMPLITVPLPMPVSANGGGPVGGPGLPLED